MRGGDRGLEEVTRLASDTNKFRTPGLRNVALTAPYMHDGEAPTLADAVRRHVPGGFFTDLSNADTEDLVEFLGTLTDHRFVTDKRFALPMKACGRRL